jgi:hypothetical protein
MSLLSVRARQSVAMATAVAAAVLLSACAQSDKGHQSHAAHMAHAGHAAPVAKAPVPATLARRTVVEATPQEVEHVLGDMQKLLRSMGEINGALAARDWPTIERVASALKPEHTMGSRDPAAVSFHAKLPPGWSGYGGPMHQGFARIADEARGERRVDEVLRTLASTTQQCVACHAQFQLRTTAVGAAR